MTAIAENNGAGCTPLSKIAKDEKISRAYLEELAQILKKEKILSSKKGVGGGYYLLKKPKEIAISDVIDALEGRSKQMGCLSSDAGCSFDKKCLSKSFWVNIKKEVDKSMSKVTLASLLIIKKLN